MPVITPGSTIVGAVQISGLAPNSTPIESWLNGMLQGKAYSLAAFSAGGAALLSLALLRNPLGSGKNLWVYMANAYMAAAGAINYSFRTPQSALTGNPGVNLLTGLVNSVGIVAVNTAATVQGSQFALYSGGTGQTVVQPQPWVIVLAPNCELLITGGTVNDSLQATFTWMEV